MNLAFFKDLLSIDSTSGKERELALWLLRELSAPSVQSFEVGDGTLNLLLSWGTPKVVFCTHMDTVPPYIPPTFPEGVDLSGTVATLGPIRGRGPSAGPMGGVAQRRSGEVQPLPETKVCGRGSCDAKGQIFAMYEACKELETAGCTDFGLLLLSGEETGSWGAKAFSKTGFEAPFLIIGEPTENKMVSASKGTKSFRLSFRGEPFHSGYPQYGVSAVDLFCDFVNYLKSSDFPIDPELGETTWNIGQLHSDNAQNILSPELSCLLYFRTTFATHALVRQVVEAKAGERLTVTPNGEGDAPAHYVTLDGFPAAPVAFGSDAPHLRGFGHKIICGPGSIRCAHRPDEHILLSDLETAVQQYVAFYKALRSCFEIIQ